MFIHLFSSIYHKCKVYFLRMDSSPWSISLSFWWHHTLLNVVALQKFLYKEIWVLQLYSFFLNNVMAFINFYKEIRWDFRGLCLICRSVWKYCHSKMACLLMETWDEFLYCVHSVVSDSVTALTVTHQAPLSLGILQTKILEWVAILVSRGSSQPRDGTQVSRIAGGFWTIRTTREVREYWSG